MQNRFLILIIFLFGASLNYAQNVLVNGYVFESGNRGYLNQVSVEIVNKSSGESVANVSTNNEGYFEVELPVNTSYVAYAQKQLFVKNDTEFDTRGLNAGEKKFLKIQMVREPGYDFEVTLAPKRDDENIPVDAIKGAWIEVYNNTTKKEVLNLKDHPELEFNVHFDKGNHYTIMVRKDGFFTKRMEAYVNVEGCILCFEGVGSVRPGVVDNLTEGNEMGVLLANVEMEPLFSGKTFEVKNIYYDLDKATLRPEAKTALNNLSLVLKDNPHIMVELGSHTDSRGKTKYNMDLSQRRAKSAVDYLVNECDVSRNSIIAQGYGESDLVNECKNGVECTEAQHQKNRRTEIKVLQVNNSQKVEKTLAEIRVEEEFLKTVMNNEVETKVVANENPENQNINPPSLEAPVDEEMEEVSEIENAEENKMIKDAVEGTQTKVISDDLAEKKLPSDFTGYKVVVMKKDELLQLEDDFYRNYPEARFFYSADNQYIYMLGDFETRAEVNTYLENEILSKFPNASIIYFEKGLLKN